MDNQHFSLLHLDLKGAPPKPAYLAKFFPFVKSLGITGILLEWEDTFPYVGEIIQIGSLSAFSASEGHYTPQEASEIIELAKRSDLCVIPLIQTFGHLDFVLKHQEFQGLREGPPCCLCPSQEGGLQVVKMIIDQIVSFHTDAEYIHIGADEVWHLGSCENCQKKMVTLKYGVHSLWLDHITAVAQFIRNKYPELKIIFWDDMLRNIDEHILQDYNMGNLLEPMVWYYHTCDDFFKNDLWNKYCKVFNHIWAASAFKGATGSNRIMPIVSHHIENQECWIRGLSNNSFKNFRGIAITGWSRYDHYATLCELLPCSIPSLFFCLITLRFGRFSPDMNESQANRLGYKFPNSLNTDISATSSICFPGCELYASMDWLDRFIKKYKLDIEGERCATWLNTWQFRMKYISQTHLLSMNITIENFMYELSLLEQKLDESIIDVFYEHTIEELKGTLLSPIKEKLFKLQNDCRALIPFGYPIKPQRTN